MCKGDIITRHRRALVQRAMAQCWLVNMYEYVSVFTLGPDPLGTVLYHVYAVLNTVSFDCSTVTGTVSRIAYDRMTV